MHAAMQTRPRPSLSTNSNTTRVQPIADDHTIVLWRLRGATHELVCTTIITSFGFALHLTLAGEPILLELQPNVDRLTEKASRLESWLLEQGWTRTNTD